jgi:hypothetical protein
MDVVGRAFFLAPKEDLEAAGYAEASTLTLIPPLLSAGACVALFFFAGPLYTFLLPLGQG